MGADTYVNEKVCEVARENMEDKIKTNINRLNAHSQDIKELTRISDKLTQLVGLQNKQLEVLTKQIEELQKAQINKTQQPTRAPWYESKTGDFLIKAGVLLLFLLMAAAIGKGFIEALEPVKNVIGK